MLCGNRGGTGPVSYTHLDVYKRQRPDILLLAGVPSESPDVICAAADLVFHPDVANMGTAVAEAAAEMGATTVVHLSLIHI